MDRATERRETALDAAITLCTSGRMNVEIGIETVRQAAQAFYEFLNPPQPDRPASGTPSGTSTEPASTPAPSKKVPAQPDNPVDF